MMPNHDHIEAHRTMNEFLGGTVLGAVVNAILAASVFFVNVWLNLKNIDEGLSLAIKLASLVVLYFSIKNGYLALKKNKAELKEKKNE
jgi:hypothetical protein